MAVWHKSFCTAVLGFFFYHVQSVETLRQLLPSDDFFAAIAVQSDALYHNGTISHFYLSFPNFTEQLIPPMLFCIDDIQLFLNSKTLDAFCSVKELMNASGLLRYLHTF